MKGRGAPMAADDRSSAETEAWRAFELVWWERFHDEEVSIDNLFPLAVEVGKLGLGKKWKRSRRARFAQLLDARSGSTINGYRVTPNRTVRRVQMWRLLQTESLELGASGDAAPAAVAEFTPSSAWQVVPDGFPCPPGGEFKMNLQTGVNLGRWPGLAETN